MNTPRIVLILISICFSLPVIFSQNILIGGQPSNSEDNEINEAVFCESEIVFSIPNTISTGITSDGERFWTCANFTEKIYTHDMAGNELGSFDVPFPNLSGMTIFRDTLWVADEQSGQLIKLDKNTGEILFTYQAPLVSSDPDDPNTYGLTNDGTHIWVADYGGNVPSSVIKINPDNAMPLDTLPVNTNSLLTIFFIDDFLYGIDLTTESLYQINTETGEITFIDFWCTDNPYDIIPLPCTGLFCTGSNNGAGPVYRIDHSGFPFFICENIEVGLCEGDVYNGTIYMENTSFTDTIDLPGFDSIYTTNIEVSPTYDITLFSTQCEDLNTEPGTYISVINLSTNLGCDSMVTNVLEVYPNKNTTFNITLMPGEEYDGMTYFSDTSIVNIYETQFGCDSIVTVNIIVEVSSNQENYWNNISAYPNPSHSTIYINGIIRNTKITVYDLLGRNIYTDLCTKDNNRINVEEWTEGIYYLVLEDDKHSIPYVEKIIVN